jgi:HEAT repeats
MKLTEEEMQGLMIDLIDGKLGGEIREMVERQMAENPAYQQEYEQLRQLLGLMVPPAPEAPDAQAKAVFAQLLAEEKQRLAQPDPFATAGTGMTVTKAPHRPELGQRTFWLRVAASVALLVGVFWLGRFSTQARLRAAEGEVAALRAKVQESNQLAMLSMLKQTSASERIKAVGYANEMPEVDEEITKALLNTLNFDPNINVKLAAAEALARFGDRPAVRMAVVASLGKQTEPMLQLSLIALLVDWKEKQALASMQQLMEDKAAPEIVRAKAAEGVGVLYQL